MRRPAFPLFIVSAVVALGLLLAPCQALAHEPWDESEIAAAAESLVCEKPDTRVADEAPGCSAVCEACGQDAEGADGSDADASLKPEPVVSQASVAAALESAGEPACNVASDNPIAAEADLTAQPGTLGAADASSDALTSVVAYYCEGTADDVRLQVKMSSDEVSLYARAFWDDADEATAPWLQMVAAALLTDGEAPDGCTVLYRADGQDAWRPWPVDASPDTSASMQILVVRVPQFSGWLGSDNGWGYYEQGRRAVGQWVVTDQSPIAADAGLQRYWIDANGTLAVSRMIEPEASLDSGSYQAFATEFGYVLRNGIAKVGGQWRMADNDGKLTIQNVRDLIEAYVNWAVGIANDNSHGYTQDQRWGPDYDCSSLAIAALKAVGFCVGAADDTSNMVPELLKYGFTFSTDLSQLQRGDILYVRSSTLHHVEIYLGNGMLVGATHSENGGIYGVAGDQTGSEIRVGPYYNAPWGGFIRAA